MTQNFLYMFEIVVDDLLVTRPNCCAPEEYPTCCEVTFRSSVYVSICDREFGQCVDPCSPKCGKCCLFALETPVTDDDRLLVHVYKKKDEKCKFLIGATDLPIKSLFDKVCETFEIENPKWMERIEKHTSNLPQPKGEENPNKVIDCDCDDDAKGRREQLCPTSELTKRLLPLFNIKGYQTGNIVLIIRLVCNGPAIVSSFPFAKMCNASCGQSCPKPCPPPPCPPPPCPPPPCGGRPKKCDPCPQKPPPPRSGYCSMPDPCAKEEPTPQTCRRYFACNSEKGCPCDVCVDDCMANCPHHKSDKNKNRKTCPPLRCPTEPCGPPPPPPCCPPPPCGAQKKPRPCGGEFCYAVPGRSANEHRQKSGFDEPIPQRFFMNCCCPKCDPCSADPCDECMDECEAESDNCECCECCDEGGSECSEPELCPCFVTPSKPPPGPEAYDEFEACLNGSGLVIRVLKDTHCVNCIDDGPGERLDNDECQQCPNNDNPKCDNLADMLKRSSIARNVVSRRTGGTIHNNPKLPKIRANIKYSGDEKCPDQFYVPFGKIKDWCDNQKNKVDTFRRNSPCKEECGDGAPACPPIDIRNCCLQVDPMDIKNALKGINMDTRKKGIEVCYKTCDDTDSDVFLVKLGSKRQCQDKKNQIEIELKTPKQPLILPKQKVTTETQINEVELDAALTGICKKGKGKGKGKKKK